MANLGVGGPTLVFDDQIEKIQKQGKAYDTGAILCYVISGLAAVATGYLVWDIFFKGKKKKAKASSEDEGTTNLRIMPTFGERSVGVTGSFQF
jgi:hypothetical protein